METAAATSLNPAGIAFLELCASTADPLACRLRVASSRADGFADGLAGWPGLGLAEVCEAGRRPEGVMRRGMAWHGEFRVD